MSYESPIKLFFPKLEEEICNIAKKQDEMVFDAVAKVGVTVDRDELLRALHYDRDQYDKGFADGKAATMDELVRCAECKHNNESRAIGESGMWCDYWGTAPDPDDFCCKGEKRDEEDRRDAK